MVKEAKPEDYKLGDDFGPVEYHVNREMVEMFSNAIEDDNPWYSKDSPFGGPVAPPTILAEGYFRLISAKLGIMSGLHTKHEAEFLNPIIVGKKVTVKGKITEKYEKRGRQYFVLEYTCIDEDGREVSRYRYTGSPHF